MQSKLTPRSFSLLAPVRAPFYVAVLVGTLASAMGACSASGEDDTGATSKNNGGAGGAGGGIGGDILVGGGTAGDGVGGGCADLTLTAQELPLDMFIMLDRSGSMSGAKWNSVTAALTGFVAQPDAAGIGVGLGFFPADSGIQCSGIPFCSSDADCGDPGCGPCQGGGGIGICMGVGANESCEPSDYAMPSVAIATLPGSAGAINAAISGASPNGDTTPTRPALEGAIDYATQWAIANPDHIVINVLATDGDPTGCSNQDLATINGLAAAGANGSPQVLTFVIGVGSSLANLNGIAAAGGTGQAFLVDTNQNVQQQFLDALNEIQGDVLGCSYSIPIPEEGTPDFNTVVVTFTGGDGQSQNFQKVNGPTECAGATGGAWYYDNNTMPTKIILCDDTCSIVSSDDMGTVDVVIDCETLIK